VLIYSMKPGHDGAVAVIDTEKRELIFSHEAEKDSFPRYEVFNPKLFIDTACMTDFPDVIAMSGWAKGGYSAKAGIGAGYYGHQSSNIDTSEKTLFGKKTHLFSSSHLRSHIMSAYALSPYEQGQPCYILVWEGGMGDFYHIDQGLNITHLKSVMVTPGNKYAFLYALADPTFAMPKGKLRYEDPGKLMALCGYGQPGPRNKQEEEITQFLLNRDSILLTLTKEDLKDSPYYNIGVEHQDFKNLARKFSDEIFDRFYQYAKENLTPGLPLLISGGCGLNCDWNTAWKNSGIFSDVFIPPCTNDSGSAIGTAVDAMWHFTGNAKLNWSVYSGPDFVDDHADLSDFNVEPYSPATLAHLLYEGQIIGWAEGKCEIGPRALGNRSILAAPFCEETKVRLNTIKKREGFRPIAPLCLEDDVSTHFDWDEPSPYMLHFQKVINSELKAIMHIDGSARVQTVNSEQNAQLHQLLQEFKAVSGAGVLCNTSLNFNGTGFINRTSDLARYCKDNRLDGFCANGSIYRLIN